MSDSREFENVEELIDRRKAEMLPLLQRQLKQHQQRKHRLRKLSLGSAVMASLVGIGFLIWARFPVPKTDSGSTEIAQHLPTVTDSVSSMGAGFGAAKLDPKYIATNIESVNERLLLRNPESSSFVSVTSTADRRPKLELGEIDDQQLLNLLSESGQRFTLAEIDGTKVVVATH